MNANMLEGLKKLQEAGYALIAAYEMLSNAAASETPTAAPEVAAPAAEPEMTGHLDKGQLSTMKISDLRKLAKEMGLSGAGTLAELVDRIAAAEVGVPSEAELTPAEVAEVRAAEAAAKKPAAAKGKAAKPVAQPEPQPQPEPEDDEDDESEGGDTEAEVRAAVADMKTEEIADLLASYKLSASGKREALIARVVEAVQKGTISFEETEEETAEDESDDDELELDETEVEDTEARKEALAAANAQVDAAIKDKSLKRKDFVAWLNDYYGTEDTMKEKSLEELIADYREKSALFIDDDGDEHEEGWYAIKGVPYCCGRPLAEEDGKYTCERCESSYDESDIYGDE